MPQRLLAQQWSDAQLEIWKLELEYWEANAAHDLDKCMGFFHPDYLGWYNQSALPSDKTEIKKWIGHDHKTTKVLIQSYKPVGIKIHDNVAIVHYYYERLIKDAEGKEKHEQGHWTDTWKKENNKWLLIGDHGGPECTEKE